MTIRVGVVGVGPIGKLHSRCYRDDPLAELVCVCDIIKERADAASAEFGVPGYYSVQEMFEAEKLDAADVCSAGKENGGDHCKPTIECLEAGLPVLCEKPLSNVVADAQRMVNTAREKGLALGTNLNHRFVPPAIRAKEWIESGKVGRPLIINMYLAINNPNETAEYFHLRALHPHSIDVMRYFCGPVKRVQAFFSKGPGRNIWSNASINMEFDGGAIGHLTGSYDGTGLHPIERCEVFCSNGRFVIDNVFEELTLFPRKEPERTVIRNSIMGGVGSFADTFKNRIHRWLEDLTNQVPIDQVEASGLDGLGAQRTIEAAIKSHETGKVIDVET
jgi:UDP-N-acetylglucosamine 3-dehydrogenase